MAATDPYECARTLVLDGCRSRQEALARVDLFVEAVYTDLHREFLTDFLLDVDEHLYAADLDETLDFMREHYAILEADARTLLRRLVCDRCDAAGVA